MRTTKRPRNPPPRSSAHLDRLLDEALQQTFPASDPVAIAVDRFPEPGMRAREVLMAKTFKVGDHVSWNSEAGRVRGRVVRVHTKDVNYKGYVHHASTDDPQYEIKSDKTDHVALHKGRALRQLRG
jgi:hypothetical protein